MNVEDLNLMSTPVAAGQTQPSGTVSERPGSSAPETRQPEAGDRVEWSGLAAKLSDVVASEAQARTERVGALERDYQAGRYTVDARATSRQLVAEALSTQAAEKAG
jgi:anti-sigma28 factor (negative regulator of flagellin synthesis)